MAVKSTAELLREAKSVISDPDKWCQGWFGLDANNEHVAEADPTCVRRCASGACWYVSPKEPDPLHVALTAALPNPKESLCSFNDQHNHADIMALFDRAIALAEASDA